MSPRSPFTTLVVVPENSNRFLDATIHYPFNNMTENSTIPITIVAADYGLISKWHMRPMLMVPVSGACVPTCGGGDDGQYSIWVSVGVSWEISYCYLASLDHANNDTASKSSEKLHPDPWRWDKTFSPHNTKKGHGFVLMRFPLIDAYVGPG